MHANPINSLIDIEFVFFHSPRLEPTCKLTMHANPRMLLAATLHLVHAAANIFVRRVRVRGDDVALDNQPCCSSPLSTWKRMK